MKDEEYNDTNAPHTAFDERTLRFLRGQMSGDEETAFKRELADDAEKRARAQTVVWAATEMRRLQQEADSEAIEQMRRSDRPPASATRNTNYKKDRPKGGTIGKLIRINWAKPLRYAAAACLAGAVFCGWVQYSAHDNTTKLGDIYTQNFVEHKLEFLELPPSRGMGNDKRLLEEIFFNVATGYIDYPIPSLMHTLSISEDENSTYHEYREYIYWHLAVAYLKRGDRNAAKANLQKIIDEFGEAEDDELVEHSKELMEQINSIFALW